MPNDNKQTSEEEEDENYFSQNQQPSPIIYKKTDFTFI